RQRPATTSRTPRRRTSPLPRATQKAPAVHGGGLPCRPRPSGSSLSRRRHPHERRKDAPSRRVAGGVPVRQALLVCQRVAHRSGVHETLTNLLSRGTNLLEPCPSGRTLLLRLRERLLGRGQNLAPEGVQLAAGGVDRRTHLVVHLRLV